MIRVIKILASISVIIIAHLILESVLDCNLKNSIYPSTLDTTFIAIAESFINSLILVLLFTITIITQGWKKWLSIISIVSGLIAALFSILIAVGWFYPNHYLIATIYILLSLMAIYLVYESAGEVTYNKRFKADTESSSAQASGTGSAN